MNFFSLKGKAAIVTGGNSGIGQAYALALAKAGADIMITSHPGTRVSGDDEETKALLEKEGARVAICVCDLSRREERKKLINECLDVYGRIDILINNAGIIRRKPVLEHSYEDYAAVVEVNQNAIFELTQLAANVMKGQGGGKIINACSMLSFQGGKFVPGYAASKHAAAGLTKSFASECAKYNIQVNAIAPGYVESRNTAPILADGERKDSISERIPFGRWATPADLMGAAVFLSSDASNYINGHVLCVDGGWMIS